MRSYMINTDGLKDAVVVKSVTSVLNNLVSKDRLNKISKYQEIDVDALKFEIKQLLENGEADNENDAAVTIIEEKYPCLYLYVCWSLGEKKRMSEYMQNCEVLGFGVKETFSKYVHGFFLPWLDI